MRQLALAVVIGSLGGGWVGAGEHAMAGAPRDDSSSAVPRHQSVRAVHVAFDRPIRRSSVMDLVPRGERTAWAVTEGNAIRAPAQAVLVTDDGGIRWRTVTPPGLSRATLERQISSFAVAPSGRAWVSYGAGARPQTLLVSDNEGGAWRPVGRLARYCTLQFVNSRDGWCTSINGAAGSEFVTIYRTTTGGRTWRRVEVTAPPGEYRTPSSILFGCAKTIAFVSPTDGFASSFCNGGGGFIDATRDGGARWKTALTLPSSPQAQLDRGIFAVVGAGRHLAAAETIDGNHGPEATAVLVSNDGGTHWRAVQPPGAPHAYLADIASARVWRLVGGRVILETNDAGNTWRTVTANVSFNNTDRILYTTPKVGWSVMQFGAGDVLRTTDGGVHWRVVRLP